jgi:hypothetical protein
LAFADNPRSLDSADRKQVEVTLAGLSAEYGYTLETAKEAIAVLLKERYSDGN